MEAWEVWEVWEVWEPCSWAQCSVLVAVCIFLDRGSWASVATEDLDLGHVRDVNADS